MTTYTNAQATKYVRSVAKGAGLTFRHSKTGARLNGARLWVFADRKTGEVVLRNCTLGVAFENCESGYISRYNPKTGRFDSASV